MRFLTAYGHSWVGGAGTASAAARLVNLTARALGLDVDNRGVSGTASTETAELVRRQPPPPADAFLIMTGLDDARMHGGREPVARATSAAPGAAVRPVARHPG